jgi:hypothetical protein
MTPDRDQRKEALDLLIDQHQRLFAIYDARRSNAEAKAAGILTATVAIAALTATAASLVKHVNLGFAVALVVLLVLSVIAAIYAASGAGLHGLRDSSEETQTETPLLSTESPHYRTAAEDLSTSAEKIMEECRNEASDAIAIDPMTVRAQTLKLWQERQLDAHHLAQRKDRGAAVAGIALGGAMACGAVVVVLIVTNSG